MNRDGEKQRDEDRGGGWGGCERPAERGRGAETEQRWKREETSVGRRIYKKNCQNKRSERVRRAEISQQRHNASWEIRLLFPYLPSGFFKVFVQIISKISNDLKLQNIFLVWSMSHPLTRRRCCCLVCSPQKGHIQPFNNTATAGGRREEGGGRRERGGRRGRR